MNFFRLFSRQPAKGALDPESWQAGDWAECVHMGGWHLYPDGSPSDGPRHGRIGRVTGVMVFGVGSRKVVGLSFERWPGHFFNAEGFRKLRPQSDLAIAAEAEFTALVRRKPVPALPRETIREWQ